MTTPTLIHEPAAHRIFGGVDETPAGTGTSASRSDRPHLGALAAAVAPGRSPAGLPHSVVLPTRLNFEGAVFPGQDAGFLGPRFDPWHLVGDPTEPGFGPTELTLPEGLTPARLDARSALLATVEARRRRSIGASTRRPPSSTTPAAAPPTAGVAPLPRRLRPGRGGPAAPRPLRPHADGPGPPARPAAGRGRRPAGAGQPRRIERLGHAREQLRATQGRTATPVRPRRVGPDGRPRRAGALG